MTVEKSADKVKKTRSRAKIIDDVMEEINEAASGSSTNNTNALVRSGDFETQLSKIEEQLSAIVDRQKNGVSAEFNALMDGYVNKANESQEFKVQAGHYETLYEELKLETKTIKEENKKFKADLEATKEALRMSESDIKRLKSEAEQAKNTYQEQITSLTDEKEQFKLRLKDVQGQNDQNLQNYNNIKSELLDQRYKSKQIDQERQVEQETYKRTGRETSKLIDELKEKLELRTREVEYKDALLNQLIKQVSAEDNVVAKTTLNQVRPTQEKVSMAANPVSSNLEEFVADPRSFLDPEDTRMPEDSDEAPDLDERHKSIRETLASKFSKKGKDESPRSWGPFKKR